MTKQASPLKSLFQSSAVWICLTIAISIWMFVLGVFVGRNTVPVKFDIPKIQDKLNKLTQSANETQKRFAIDSLSEDNKIDFEFHEELQKNESNTVADKLTNKPKVETPAKVVLNDKKEETKEKTVEKIVEKKPLPEKNEIKEGFTVQVASLKDIKDAEKIVRRLIKKGYQAYTVSGTIPEKGMWHRVRVGVFKNKEKALDVLNKLKQEKFKPILIKN